MYARKIYAERPVSIMQAQHNLSKVIRGLGPGERVAITRNKQRVSELIAPRSQTAPEFPEFAARAQATWGDPWVGSSTEQLVDETRGER